MAHSSSGSGRRLAQTPGAVVHTTCPLDCPDTCSLAVTVQEGRVTTIDGSRRHGVTDGYICAKVRHFDRRVYGPDRVLFPAVRVGRKGDGRFERVSWDDALGRVAEAMSAATATHGGASILPFSYGGSNGFLTQDTLDATLWRRLGASRLDRTVCAAPTMAAHQGLYGRMASVTYEDIAHAALIVVWGANPSVSGLHLLPLIRDAQRRGATLVVVDPRTTPLAAQADLHLAVRPGTDLVVALALHRWLFTEGLADLDFLRDHATHVETLRSRAEAWTLERAAETAGVAAADLERFARLYADASPALLRLGWGPERNRNGGSAAAAILALPAVAGKFGVRGGGYATSNSGAWRLHLDASRAPESPARRVNMNHLGRALTEYQDPPVQCLFVYNANPAVTVPDQQRVLRGLSRDDLFTVVFDQVMTDTALYADVLLPATTFLEHYDLRRAYGPLHMDWVRPAIDPVGEARPNADVFAELCARLGVREDGDPTDELEAMLGVLGALPAPIATALGEGALPTPPCGPAPVQFVDVFPHTTDGKIDLCPADLDAAAPAGLYGYQPDPSTEAFPLTLISPATDKTINSTLGELPGVDTSLTMHPTDAAARGLEAHDRVRVFNALGEVETTLTVSGAIRPGTVSLAKGVWRRVMPRGTTATTLVPDSLTDVGGGACFNDARVQVTSAPQA